MRVLVTGGAGYIGSFSVRALQEAGHDVVVYDNLSFGHPQAVDAPIVVADLADAHALDHTLEEGKFDAVMHFAASIEAGLSMVEGGRFFQNNTGNAITLLNAVVRHGITQFIFSSTAAVYGNPQTVPIPETAPREPTSVYGESKLLVEHMLPWYDLVHGLRSVSLRYFNATGAALDGSIGQDHEPATHLITVALQAALGKRAFTLHGTDYPTPDGTCIRDYIHVIDVASAHVVALDYLAGGGTSEVYNVGTGRGSSNLDVLATVKRVTGVDFRVELGPRRPGDPAELAADSTKLQQALGWRPEHSDLDTIVRSAWEWHRMHPDGYATDVAASR